MRFVFELNVCCDSVCKLRTAILAFPCVHRDHHRHRMDIALLQILAQGQKMMKGPWPMLDKSE